MLARVALVALTVGLLSGVGQAGQPFVPSWIWNDPAIKTVSMEIVADWNQVARYAEGNVRTDIIDFNGYPGGNIRARLERPRLRSPARHGGARHEARRVLRDGGTFAVYEVMRTGDGDLAFPIPWAETADLSRCGESG